MSQLSCYLSLLSRQSFCLGLCLSESGEESTGQCRHFGELAVLSGKAVSFHFQTERLLGSLLHLCCPPALEVGLVASAP